jgi:hypothetical protein
MLRSGCQRHRQRPVRTLAIATFDGLFAEEDVARVGVQQFAEARRIGARPLLDALHRGLVEAHFAALDEQFADRLIGVAVLVGEGQARHAAVGQADAPRALDLQKEEFNRVVDPEQNATALGLVAPGDLGSRVVGNDLVALQATAQAQVLEFRLDGAEIDVQQVGGAPRTASR